MRVRQVSSWAATCALSFFTGRSLADTMSPGDPATTFDVEDAVSGLDSPTSFAFLPDGRMLITEKGQQGATTADLLIADSTGTTKVAGTFQVSTTSEQGLLHVILHPSFATNHLLIFYYSAGAANADPGTNTDRHRIVTIPLVNDVLDMSQERILVRGLHGPANHDGGSLGIGPDGKLYIGDGDTGSNSNKNPLPAYTPTNYYGTCLTVPNGKILRVNLDGSIPSDNPLVGKQATACAASNGTDPTTVALTDMPRTDIWAWGFRNPWRFWFDPKTGNLWVGDVGEITYEEIDVIPQSKKGQHFGWPYREGGDVAGTVLQGHDVTTCDAIKPTGADCVDPQYFCKHGTAANGVDGNCGAVTGGLIVDSCTFPTTFRGRYFYADSARHWVGTLQPTADRSGIVAGSRQMLTSSNGQPVHLDVGPDNNLYYAVIAGAGSSTIERVKPKTPETCPVQTGSGGASGSGGGAATGGGSSAGGSGSGTGGGSGAAGAPPGGGTGTGGGPGSGAGGTLGGGATSGGGAATGGPDGSVGDGGPIRGGIANADSSCGCRTVAASSAPSGGLLALAGLSLLVGRRRARARRR